MLNHFLIQLGRYKRLIAAWNVYKNIKRAKVDPKMRLLLFEKLKDVLAQVCGHIDGNGLINT